MLLADFWSFVDKSAGEEGCWPWTRAINKSGYGSVWIDKRSHTASRLAYELANGPIPHHDSYHGLVVRHDCDNRRCCNPKHLRIGARGENNEDRDRRQRVKSRCRGERNHHASLTEQMVRHIRDLRRQGFSLRQIATRMHITKSVVAHVSSGKSWGWLSDTPLGHAAIEREGLRP